MYLKMSPIEGVLLLIVIAVIVLGVYIYITGGSFLCGIAGLNLWCKCPSNDARVSGGDPDGNCWTCPKINGSQTLRTGDSVTSTTACGGDCGSMYKGGFPDIIDNGTCWSCPPNFSIRTGDPVNTSTACKCTDGDCAKRYPGNYGQVVSDLTLNQCWACPPGKVRTIYRVDGKGIGAACGDPNGVFDTKVPAKLLGPAVSAATNHGPYRFAAKLSKMRLW
jgi:hypothetical protein